MMKTKIWLITGASAGLGRALMNEVLETGDICIGTVRKPEQKQELDQLKPGRSFGALLDVTDDHACHSVIQWVNQEFGKLDVLVNNAGFGYFGAMEELSMDECRDQFETNVFGAIRMSQLALPIMRAQGSGAVVQISSIAGFRSAAGLGIYNASKYALEGLSEAMYHELKPLGIRVHLIEPGPFRTEFAGRSSKIALHTIEDYAETAGAFRRGMAAKSGKQEGDPRKAALKIIKLLDTEGAPLRLPLGKWALDGMRAKMQWVQEEISAWEKDILDTDFDS